MQKRWTVRKVGDSELINRLSGQFNISPVLTNLLIQRGIDTFDKAKRFFRPSTTHLHDPFLMKDMDKAVRRILAAINKKEKILIYGDYDVDGTTAVALLYTFLKKFHKYIDFYIPDRYSEGYGISYQSIDFAKENNFKLIIALDCGIKAVDKIDYANTKGIDFIICDHHRPGEFLPKAYAVLDPKRADCEYPYKDLSGCGVGFKLAQAFCNQRNLPFEELTPLLDLLAISICADIVPITGENRVFTKFGLELLNAHPRIGIKTILELNNFKRQIDVSDIVFVIAPRINAAGRVNSGKSAVELLISEDYETALRFAKTINIDNNTRKDLDTQITQEALVMIEQQAGFKYGRTSVLFDPGWHKGVVGIVASRVIDQHYKPTVVLTESDEFITGSARSIKDFDIYDALEACSDLLEHFGGHMYAAGLTMKRANLEAFRERFEQFAQGKLTDDMMVPEMDIDAEIELSLIDNKFFGILKQFAPFGPENMRPVFSATNVIDKGYAKIVGTNHLKMDLCQPNSSSNYLKSIAFQQGNHFTAIARKIPFNICFSIEENEWNGDTSLQLNIKDICL